MKHLLCCSHSGVTEGSGGGEWGWEAAGTLLALHVISDDGEMNKGEIRQRQNK